VAEPAPRQPREEDLMFERLEMAPPDPILGLTAAFREDANPDKINLGVGVYQDAEGKTPIFGVVKRAEERVLAAETTKSYLPIEGPRAYALAVQELLLDAGHEAAGSGRAITVQAPGGTGALRVAGDLIHQHYPRASIWLSDPTWANHPKIFAAAGVPVRTYPYFDAATAGLALERLLAAVQQIPAGDVLLLHGCCHNPTGVDPTLAQWGQLAAAVRDRGVLPLVDFAYQGLGDGLRADARGLQALCQPGTELMVASSFSKNFGLYSERVGALTLVAADADAAGKALSQLKAAVRTNYSNPPAHGSAIVTEVLTDPVLRAGWEAEVDAMRARIHAMRQLFVTTLAAQGVTRNFAFIQRQRGMFSFSGLTDEQVRRLRQEYSIYMVGSGRMNVAGMTEANMGRLCRAIAAVL
jgi:aspartate/tyrosine/aromatic aminotransferase